jgi:hypothetical protein
MDETIKECSMVQKSKLLPIYILQILPLLLFPPATLRSGLIVVVFLALIIVLLDYGLLKGRAWALSLSMFLQGFNVIIRIMMLFPHAIRPENLGGGLDLSYISINILAIVVSLWFLLRLDRPDVRSTLIA